MFFIIGVLQAAAPLGLLNGPPHGIGHVVGIHDDPSLGVPGGPAYGLDQRGLRTQEAFLVRVQDHHQGDLGNIQAFPQQVDADQHIEDIQAHVPDDLGPFQRIDVRVQIADPDPGPGQVIGQVLRHLFGERGDQNLVTGRHRLPDFADQVVDLAFHRTDIDLGIQQACGTDDLFRPQQLMVFLIRARCRGDKEQLIDMLLKFLKTEGAVIQGGGQAETIIHQGLFPGPVSVVHGADLGDGHVRLVDNDQEIPVKEIHQGQGRFAGLHKVQMAGIVLNAGAEACLPHHFDIKVGPFGDSLGLQQLILALEIEDPLLQFLFDVVAGPVDLFLGDHIVGGRIDHDVLQGRVQAAGQLVHLADPVDLVPEPFQTDQIIAALSRIELQGISADPEIAAVQGHVVAGVLDGDQVPDDLIPVPGHAGPQGNGHALEFLGAAQAVDAGDAGHDDHIPALGQGSGGGQAQLVDLIIDGRVLGDIGIAGGHIGLRLIVIIIGNKIFHGVLRKELLHLPVELAGQGLVMGDDQGRLVQGRDDIGHREGLARPRDAQKGLELVAFPESPDQVFDGGRLVSRGLIFGMQYKMIHGFLLRIQ